MPRCGFQIHCVPVNRLSLEALVAGRGLAVAGSMGRANPYMHAPERIVPAMLRVGRGSAVGRGSVRAGIGASSSARTEPRHTWSAVFLAIDATSVATIKSPLRFAGAVITLTG